MEKKIKILWKQILTKNNWGENSRKYLIYLGKQIYFFDIFNGRRRKKKNNIFEN